MGVCVLELRLPHADSLKDKRRVIKSLRDRVRNRYNVSVAEVDHQDHHKLATLGLAMVCGEAEPIQRVFDEIVRTLDGQVEVELLSHRVEFY
ncbi:MAG: DUF503 domain-containing protein [Clostridia bacterium]|nr:DUF503 domain-containing protein [Clostridia bacterium]MDH7573214.1 DUF503 domain-containing protein [Clostridia bacterium]